LTTTEVPFFRDTVTVKEPCCWFTYILEALTRSAAGADALDALTVVVGVDALTMVVGVDAMTVLVGVGAVTALVGVVAVTALSSARPSSGSTWIGVRRRDQ
jgi:hypothetical protein